MPRRMTPGQWLARDQRRYLRDERRYQRRLLRRRILDFALHPMVVAWGLLVIFVLVMIAIG